MPCLCFHEVVVGIWSALALPCSLLSILENQAVVTIWVNLWRGKINNRHNTTSTYTKGLYI